MRARAAIGSLLLVIGAGAASAANIHSLKVGESFQFVLEGNPSTGYRWQLDAATSAGLGTVRVDALGYLSRPSGARVVVGAPAPFAFQITCLRPGAADLHFVYVRATGQRSGKSGRVALRCR